jgi:hypothetical protein
MTAEGRRGSHAVDCCVEALLIAFYLFVHFSCSSPSAHRRYSYSWIDCHSEGALDRICLLNWRLPSDEKTAVFLSSRWRLPNLANKTPPIRQLGEGCSIWAMDPSQVGCLRSCLRCAHKISAWVCCAVVLKQPSTCDALILPSLLVLG